MMDFVVDIIAIVSMSVVGLIGVCGVLVLFITFIFDCMYAYQRYKNEIEDFQDKGGAV